MHKLSTSIRDYAWGSRTALAELLGREASGRAEAELWVGAHPGAPSLVQPEGITLTEVIASDPESTLGPDVAQRYGRLPYLMKLLAAEAPLSLQVHPNADQAVAGFAAEDSAGPPVDSPSRNYKDDRHKPELILALTPFDALSGFRSTEESQRAFRWLSQQVTEPGAAAAAAGVADALAAGRLETAAALILDRGEDLQRLVTLGARAVEEQVQASAEDESVAHPSRTDASLGLLPRLAKFYPKDVGVLLALLLNLVRLAPGEAMSLPSGNIHAYLEGVGVEVMANSDNVLRGGMTSKHVDVDELMRIVTFEPLEAHRVVPTSPAPGLEIYVSGFDEVDLARLSHAEAPVELPVRGPAEVVVVAGRLELLAADGSELVLGRGESGFIPYADQPVRARGSAELDAYVALRGNGAASPR